MACVVLILLSSQSLGHPNHSVLYIDPSGRLSYTSASQIRTGSNETCSGGVLHASLCFTEPCTSL